MPESGAGGDMADINRCLHSPPRPLMTLLSCACWRTAGSKSVTEDRARGGHKEGPLATSPLLVCPGFLLVLWKCDNECAAVGNKGARLATNHSISGAASHNQRCAPCNSWGHALGWMGRKSHGFAQGHRAQSRMKIRCSMHVLQLCSSSICIGRCV